MFDLKLAPIWTTWRFTIVKEGEKPTKVPHRIDGRKASSTDPLSWTTFEKAKKAQSLRPDLFDGIGIVLGPISGVIGIDFDLCEQSNFEDFIKQANTYVEFSPSKTGFHLLFKCKEEVILESHKYYFKEPTVEQPTPSHVEIYSDKRYFTFTENETELSKPIRDISRDDFIALIATLGYPWEDRMTHSSHQTRKSPVSAHQAFSDEIIINKMFRAKNGLKVKALYEGDVSEHSNDDSSADYALCLHLAFWTQKNYEQIERIWLASPLGQRKKTQEREDYRKFTIEKAIKSTQETYGSSTRTPLSITKTSEDTDIDYDFILGGSTDLKPAFPLLIWPNINRVLKKNPYLKNKFRKNEFSHLVETCLSSEEWVSLNDDAISRAREYVAENFPSFRKISKDLITDAIMRVASDTKVNPPRDYLTSLVWDKVPRLDSWLHHAYGTPDDELNRSIGSNWLKGLVKRVMVPGCQFDEVLALESPQGWRKSTSIRALGHPWHVETAHSIDNKDFYLLIAQNIIVEFSEGEIFDRASVKKLKAEITKTEDQVRPPYERGIVKFKRSCVFAVTTNKLELKDDTGNRRWLPVTLEKSADIDWIKENRDQLYAEAFHRVMVDHETTHEYPLESLEELQETRAEHGIYDEKALKWYLSLLPFVRDEEGISLQDACCAIYGVTPEVKIPKLDELQAASILRRTLFLESRNKRINGAVLKRWFPTRKTMKLINASVPPKLNGQYE